MSRKRCGWRRAKSEDPRPSRFRTNGLLLSSVVHSAHVPGQPAPGTHSEPSTWGTPDWKRCTRSAIGTARSSTRSPFQSSRFLPASPRPLAWQEMSDGSRPHAQPVRPERSGDIVLNDDPVGARIEVEDAPPEASRDAALDGNRRARCVEDLDTGREARGLDEDLEGAGGRRRVGPAIELYGRTVQGPAVARRELAGRELVLAELPLRAPRIAGAEGLAIAHDLDLVVSGGLGRVRCDAHVDQGRGHREQVRAGRAGGFRAFVAGCDRLTGAVEEDD